MSKSIIIIGSSGLIGNELLKQALEHKEIENVTILVRKSLGLKSNKLTEIITNFQDLDRYKSLISGDGIFCCLGTTRKKTPDKSIYTSIDLGLTLKIALLAQQQEVKQIHLISAVGANPNSSIFYNRLKGQIENAIINLDFPNTYIYRPSLLIGSRQELRIGELMAQKLAPIFDFFLFGKLKKYHSIGAHIIANSMLRNFFKTESKLEILEYNKIKSIF